MSDYAYVADQARRAFASVARLERALAEYPERRDIQLHLDAERKRARRADEQMRVLAEYNHLEVCDYRLLPETQSDYPLRAITGSLLNYQLLFSQVHDAKKNGIQKSSKSITRLAAAESELEFGYSYSGSLGVVLLTKSKRDFWSGNLDASIEALYEAVNIQDQNEVRDLARALGGSVVKRVHDWSESNVVGGYSADVRWKLSTGKQMAEVIPRRKMAIVLDVISSTSDETVRTFEVSGFLVGGDLVSSSFHFSEPDGESYKGKIVRDFNRLVPMRLGARYSATLRETSVEHYATEKTDRWYELLSLTPLEKAP